MKQYTENLFNLLTQLNNKRHELIHIKTINS